MGHLEYRWMRDRRIFLVAVVAVRLALEVTTPYPLGLDWAFYYRNAIHITPFGIMRETCDGFLYTPYILPYLLTLPFTPLGILGMKLVGFLIFLIGIIMLYRSEELSLSWLTYPAMVFAATHWGNFLAITLFLYRIRRDSRWADILGMFSHPTYSLLTIARTLRVIVHSKFSAKGLARADILTTLTSSILLLLYLWMSITPDLPSLIFSTAIFFVIAMKLDLVMSLGLLMLLIFPGRGIFLTLERTGKIGFAILALITFLQLSGIHQLYTDINYVPTREMLKVIASKKGLCVHTNDPRLIPFIEWVSRGTTGGYGHSKYDDLILVVPSTQP